MRTVRGIHFIWLATTIAGTLGAQSPPKAIPGRAITTWQAKDFQGFEVREIRARNDTTVPLLVTRIRLGDCKNIRTSCDSIIPDLLILQPGKITSVATVLPSDILKKFSFTSELDVRPATESEIGLFRAASRVGGVADPGTGKLLLAGTTHPSSAKSMVILPAGAPMALRGQSLTITFFVSERGKTDSVAIPPITDQRYLKRLREALMKYTFRPATLDGAAVASTATMTITF